MFLNKFPFGNTMDTLNGTVLNIWIAQRKVNRLPASADVGNKTHVVYCVCPPDRLHKEEVRFGCLHGHWSPHICGDAHQFSQPIVRCFCQHSSTRHLLWVHQTRDMLVLT